MACEKTFGEQIFEGILSRKGGRLLTYEKDWEGRPTHPLVDVFEIPNVNFC